MTKIKQLINSKSTEIENVKRQGWLTDKVLNEIKMNTSVYEHLEVVDYLYDEDISQSIWYDVEGFGYGWKWMKHEEENWHTMLSEFIFHKCDVFKNYINNTYYIVSDDGKAKAYYLMYIDLENNYRKDCRISFSNEELFN